MPGWLIAVFVILGIVGAFVGLIFLIRAKNKKGKLKFKEIKQSEESFEPQPQSEPADLGSALDENEFEGINFDEPTPEPAPQPQVERYNPFDFDDDFSDEDEINYRDFMRRRAPVRRRNALSADEEFEKFRREYCYSKFVTDSELAKALHNAPKDVRQIILDDLLKKLNLNDYNDIKL